MDGVDVEVLGVPEPQPVAIRQIVKAIRQVVIGALKQRLRARALKFEPAFILGPLSATK
jgi:hypothetical protein